MSKQYLESVPANEVPLTFGEVPKDWIYYAPFECWLRPVSLPVQDGDDAAEKEVMMQAFDKVYKLFRQRDWIMEGRGSYRYDDDRYKEEVRYLFDEFDTLWKDTWNNIKSKSVDFRKKVIADYLATPTVTTQGEGISDIFHERRDLFKKVTKLDKSKIGIMHLQAFFEGIEYAASLPEENDSQVLEKIKTINVDNVYEWEAEVIDIVRNALDSPVRVPAAGGPGTSTVCKKCKRDVHGSNYVLGYGMCVDCVSTKAAEQLAGGQSAGVWVTDKLPPTGMIKSYFCKLWSEHLKQEYRGLILFNKTGWAQTEYKILAWLDDSLQPATTGEGTAFAEWAVTMCSDIPRSVNQSDPYIWTYAGKDYTTAELYHLFTTSPNATERQEGEKKGGPGIDEPFLCDVCGTNTVSKDGDMCNVCNHP